MSKSRKIGVGFFCLAFMIYAVGFALPISLGVALILAFVAPACLLVSLGFLICSAYLGRRE